MAALRLRTPPTQREPRESQGCHPVTTLRGSFFGRVKWDRKPWMNIPSNSRGNSTAESCPATVILTTVAIESLDLSVSRQPRLGTPRRVDTPVRGVGLVEQATALKSADRAN